MGCCSDCDKGKPCAGDKKAGTGQTMTERAHPNDPPGAAVWEVMRRPVPMTPLQAAMMGRTMMARIAGSGVGVRHRHPFVGVGQTTDPCASINAHLRNPNDPTSECVSNISGKGDSDCSQTQLMDFGNGQCSDPCPGIGNAPGPRPNNGNCGGLAQTANKVSLWFADLAPWQKALVIGVPVAAVGGGAYLLLRKKKHKKHR